MPLNFRSKNCLFKPRQEAIEEKSTLTHDVITSLKSNIDFVALGTLVVAYKATDCGIILSWALGAVICMCGRWGLDKVEDIVTTKPAANRP